MGCECEQQGGCFCVVAGRRDDPSNEHAKEDRAADMRCLRNMDMEFVAKCVTCSENISGTEFPAEVAPLVALEPIAGLAVLSTDSSLVSRVQITSRLRSGMQEG